MDDLTPREREVLALLAKGYSNQTIADLHVTSERTVRHQVYTIMAKLDARNRTHAVVIALQTGMLTLDNIPIRDEWGELLNGLEQLQSATKWMERVARKLAGL